MANGRYWSIDELAARKLLADLQLAETDELVDKVAGHFSDHRRNVIHWTADRVHGGIVNVLDNASQPTFAHHSEDWSRGFRSAEELIVTTSVDSLLDLEPDQTRSKGQILRALVRQARKSES